MGLLVIYDCYVSTYAKLVWADDCTFTFFTCTRTQRHAHIHARRQLHLCVHMCVGACSPLTLKRVSESVKLAIQRSDRDRLVKLLLQEIPLTKNCFSVSVKTMSTSETVSVRERESK